MAKFIIALFLLLSTQQAWGQAGNDFPYFPQIPPTVDAGVHAPLPGYGDIKTGWVQYWSRTSLRAGDIVEFDVDINWFPGWLVLEPWLSDGSRITLIGPNPGAVQFGNVCTSCRFSTEIGSDFPDFGLHAIAPYRFIETHGAGIKIIKVTPKPVSSALLKQWQKDAAGEAAIYMGVFGRALQAGAPYVAVLPDGKPIALIMELFAVATLEWSKPSFEKMQSDPWDWLYQYLYEPQPDGNLAYALSQYCYEVEGIHGKSRWELMEICWDWANYFLWTEAHLKAVLVTIDRIESCALAGDSCQYWQRDWGVQYSQQSGNYLYMISEKTRTLANHTSGMWMYDPAIDGWYDVTATIGGLADIFSNAAYLMWEVQ